MLLYNQQNFGEVSPMISNETKRDISLLFPEGIDGEGLYSSKGLSEETASQLDLYSLLDLSSVELGAFFTCSARVIRYRQKTFADVFAIPLPYGYQRASQDGLIRRRHRRLLSVQHF